VFPKFRDSVVRILMKKIIIAGGGTGGHIYPGICIARQLINQNEYTPVFIIKKNDRAINLLNKEGFQYHEINISGLPRKPSIAHIKFLFNLFISLFQTIYLLLKIRPAYSFGLGGYISFPVIFMSWLFRVPTIIHEQNYIPGLTTKILSRFCSKVAISFPQTKQYLKNKQVVLAGNPVREEIRTISRDDAYSVIERLSNKKPDKSKFTALVFGGSQGAAGINRVLPDTLRRLNCKDKVQVIHITGEKEFDSISAQYNEIAGITVIIFPYLENIAAAYSIADLVICRSGATTISELIAVSKPAILIPFPYATENHQKFNALYLGDAGAAEVLEEKDMTSGKLAGLISNLAASPQLLDKMKSAYKQLPFINTSKFVQTIFL